MTDIHTHILPGMDDGARDVDMSLAMLRMEAEQGVDIVVLSPHFYGLVESTDSFLSRRERALELLRGRIELLGENERAALPRLITGAEVAWVPNLADLPRLRELCIGSSDNLLLELPFTLWDKSLAPRLCDFISRTGLNPVLVHLERYIPFQPRERLEEILALGLSVQLSAELLLRGGLKRGRALRALGSWAQLIAGDCHDVAARRPCLGRAMAVAEKKLGPGAVARMELCARAMLGEIDIE